MKGEKALDYFYQFYFTLIKHWEAIDFTRRYRLWEGFWKYGWVSRLFIVIGLILGLKFLSVFLDWIGGINTNSPLSAFGGMSELAFEFAEEGYDLLFMGGMKYVILVFLEIIIFHVSRLATSILTGQDSEASFNAFVKAQIRMFKVALRSWILELVATVILSVAFGIFGFLAFLKPATIFFIQAYFMGFAVFDNYSEQFGLDIQKSAKLSRQYAGVTLCAGIVLQILFLLPLVGTILGSLISAVAVTLVMYELSDLHLAPAQPPSDTADALEVERKTEP